MREIGRAAGWDGEIVTMPGARMPEHLRRNLDTDQHLVTDTSRIRRELGYKETIPRDEALRRTVVWERANPPGPASFDYAAEDAALAGSGRPLTGTR